MTMRHMVISAIVAGVLLSTSMLAWAQDAQTSVSFKQQLDNWLPGMGTENIPDRRQSQQALQEALIELGAPGRGAELAAACKAVADKLGPKTAKPARVWMLRQLEFNGGAECVAAVAVLLRDEDPQIRDCARRALQNNPAPEANARLLEGLADAVDDVQRVPIINALGSRADPSSAEAVLEQLVHKDEAVAAAAIKALGRIGIPQVAAPLNPDLADAEGKISGEGTRTDLKRETLESATFYIYVHAPRDYPIPKGQTINVHRVTSPWEESTVTWVSFAAAYSPDVEGSFIADTLGWHSVDVTALVRSWLDGSNDNHGFLLDQAPVTHPRVRYASRDGDRNKPYLEIGIKEKIRHLRIEPLADAYMYEPGDPRVRGNPPFGRSTDLYTGRTGPGEPAKQTLIKFDFSPVDTRSLPEVTRTTRQPASAPARDNVITNTIGMKLKLIQPGSFMMGSTKGYDSEKPVHKVTLARPFYLGVYEVTQEQYERVMGTNPSRSKASDLLPVEMISWEDAVEFCRKLSAAEGLEYCLPTEAEWEYACRAGTTTPYSMGAAISTDQANFNGKYTYVGGVKGVYRGKTMKVGSFAPNAWGLYDMHGNVWEWCADWFGSDYYKKSREINPAGPASGAFRVLRGGGLNSDPRHVRSAFRLSGHRPDYRSFISSFRIVREAAAVLNTAAEQANPPVGR